MSKRNISRRTEEVDPRPLTAPVKFQKPPTLAEQIARYMGAHNRYVASQEGEESPEDFDDFGTDEEDEHFQSPHELVYDEQLNRELTRYEKAVLDKQRKSFDAALTRKIRDEKAAAEAAERAAAIDAKRKKQKIDESADADEEQ